MSAKCNFLTRKEAAEFLGVSERTLANWASLGNRGPSYFRVGRVSKYSIKDLLSFLEANRVSVTQHQDLV